MTSRPFSGPANDQTAEIRAASPTRSSKARPFARVPRRGRYAFGIVMESPIFMPSFATSSGVRAPTSTRIAFSGPRGHSNLGSSQPFGSSTTASLSPPSLCTSAGWPAKKLSSPPPRHTTSRRPSFEIDFTSKPISSMCATTRIRGDLFPSATVPTCRTRFPASSVSGFAQVGKSFLTSSRTGPSWLLTP